MVQTDVLIIGGSATGLVAGLTAKSSFPDKEVMIIRKEEKVMVPCGIPYIFGTVGTSDNNILPDQGLINLGVKIVIDEVVAVDTTQKICTTAKGETVKYDKLVLGTGSVPSCHRVLSGGRSPSGQNQRCPHPDCQVDCLAQERRDPWRCGYRR